MKWDRWAVVDNPDNGEPPIVIETFFFWTNAMAHLAWMDVFNAGEYERLEVIKL